MVTKVCIFDAYGTLFDVAAAARLVAQEADFAQLAETWPRIAGDWRDKQLQYTWIRALTGAHTDFWTVTAEALDWALAAAGMDGDAALRARLLELYRELPAYPEVHDMLAALRAQGVPAAILSNGAPSMLEAAVRSAGIGALLDDVLSVEAVGVFKPDRRVYDLVGARFGTRPDEVLFVSANGWDAAAATGYGFGTVWVNRMGLPVDRLPWHPHRQLPDLSSLPQIAGTD